MPQINLEIESGLQFVYEIEGIVNDVKLAILEDMMPITDDGELDIICCEKIRNEIISQIKNIDFSEYV